MWSGFHLYFIVVFICISLVTNDVDHLSLCLFTMYVLFGEMSIQILCSFFKIWIFLLLSCKCSHLTERRGSQIFSPILWTVFSLSWYWSTVVFNFDEDQFPIFTFVPLCLQCHSQEIIAWPEITKVCPVLPSKRFRMIHFELCVV